MTRPGERSGGEVSVGIHPKERTMAAMSLAAPNVSHAGPFSTLLPLWSDTLGTTSKCCLVQFPLPAPSCACGPPPDPPPPAEHDQTEGEFQREPSGGEPRRKQAPVGDAEEWRWSVSTKRSQRCEVAPAAAATTAAAAASVLLERDRRVGVAGATGRKAVAADDGFAGDMRRLGEEKTQMYGGLGC